MKNKELLKNFMVGWGEIHDKKITKILLNAYFESLRPFDDTEVESVLNWATAHLKFFPKPAELIERLMETTHLNSPEQGWAEIMRILPKWADYSGGPIASDPIAHQCVRTLGGYLTVAMMPTDQLQWQEKRFREHYENLSASPHRIRQLQVTDQEMIE